LIKGVSEIVVECYSWHEDCLSLRTGCVALGGVLESNKDLLKDDPSMKELEKSLKACKEYLDECKTKKFLRNRIFEIIFTHNIKKHDARCKDWLLKALFSIAVNPSNAY
jgi:hypothetical protein